ncbi:MAG: Pleiotropic regulatory protein [uncultured Aureispira sp.]|uniref:Pleiotropic regulatory protein n=1 Tax=uncultured Aureispira sp. TaxID=1331704 RepID=A0A6S6U9W8_9BACT|nr:MAG: Pleiotropic regulatory protein [uncultured Aureispira sp.]
MRPIQMVDLKAQYQSIKKTVDTAILDCIESGAFINGPQVKNFKAHLEDYLAVDTVIPCANGTDALQIALMGLGLQPGDEVIVPTFTYVATAEVIGLLQLTPVMVDVDPDTFNVTAALIEPLITNKTKAIVPVHLFGQSADMEPILALAKKHKLYVVEDNAQAIGADYTFSDGRVEKTGTLGDIGTTSFYPSKNLGAYGDGGAIFTQNEGLGKHLQMIASHGQNKRYYHQCIGVNSRLDSIQAAVLDIKLVQLDAYAAARQAVAAVYDQAFESIEGVQTPVRQHNSTHVFHQYTLKVPADKRAALQVYLKGKGIPSMIYYPVPLNEQEAFKGIIDTSKRSFPVTEQLCQEVLSLPIHTEMDAEQLAFITTTFCAFFE